MQTALIIVGIVAIVFVALAIADLLRKIGKASEDLSHFLKVIEEELSTTAHDVRATLNDADRLISDLADTTGRINRLTGEIERLAEGAQVASAAAKAVKSSTAGLFSVYEGVKQGIKALWGTKETDKEDTFDE